jgi:ABC-2 type transport system ATP-binding protein
MVVAQGLPLIPAAIVQVRALKKRYRRRIALDGVDLTLERGELHGLIGPDGSGKSSLLKAIAGVLTFDSGSVSVCGLRLDSERAAESVMDRIGFMPQGLGHHLYPNLSVEENIDFFARLRLVPEAQLARRKERLLAMTRLGGFRMRAAKALSGGMKQKLGLVCTLIHEPELLVLDEPTTGVDPVSRRDFWEILTELLRERAASALISTAYLDEASRFDRVTLVHAARVVASGEPQSIVAAVPGTVVSMTAPKPDLLQLALEQRFPQTDIVGSEIRVFVPGCGVEAARREVSAVVPELDAGGFRTSMPELEDAFVAQLARAEGAASTRVTVADRPPPDAAGAVAPGASEEAAVEAEGLTKSFGHFTAASEVSFSVPRGEIFGLLGANGAGKTTVIKMLTGILSPTRGTGRVAGEDMRAAPRSIKERIGYMSQSFSLYTDLTALENIRLYAGVYGLDHRVAEERTRWVLEIAGLGAHRNDRAESLPMGMRQRLALGCALVHRPQVLFLDEPTAGVDAVGRRQIWQILFHLARGLRVAILVTTHYMSEAERCDRLALMYGGHIVAAGTPQEMKDAAERDIGRVLEVGVSDPRGAVAALRAASFPGVMRFGRHVHMYSKAPGDDAARVKDILRVAGIGWDDTSNRPPSMEDVFVSHVMRLEAGGDATHGAS